MALFPGLAQAEENTGIQYESDVPTVPSHESSNIPSKNKSNAPSEKGSEASSSNSPGGGGSGGSNDPGQGGGAHSGQSSQGGGGDGQQSGDGSQNAGGKVNAAQALPTTTDASQSSDGGSSPLVPILIAVALLAAISIGYYVSRQRRQGSDSAVSSPKAS
jgi:cobalamin biosynthesis Mg chelatase CobN